MTGFFLFDSKSDFKNEIAFAELVSDYGAVTENLYKAGTVDIESAKKNAMTRIQANWGRGEFGLMKYPPEKFPAYQLNETGDTSYIRDEIYNDLQANGITVERENISLIADAETSRSAGNNQPTYAIMIRASDGTLQSVSALDPDGNMSSRFQPDVEKGNILQAARIKAEEEGKRRPTVTNYIGECYLKIANHLSYRPNFINYTYRDDMISDGIENCLQYMDNFDPAKSKNPFAYFTQIIYYAFIRRIQKEKKQQQVKQKMIANFGEEQMMDQLDGDDTVYQSQMLEFLRRNSREEPEADKKKEVKK